MHTKINLHIKCIIPLACCISLFLSSCGTRDYTPIIPEDIQMQTQPFELNPSYDEHSGQDSEIDSATNPDSFANPTDGDSVSSGKLPSENNSVAPSTEISAPALPQPGVQSIENLLRTALLPVGTTMYVWGGGWNEADTGAGTEALTLGLSDRWATFAAAQDDTYNFDHTRYQIHDGLDCSGYLGWVIYNVFHTENSTREEDGYVMSSTKMAETFAGYGWGEYLTTDIDNWKPGDICSMSGHVWLSLGQCSDGSVLLLHSSPPGVRLSGTRLADGSDSQAVALARQYMSTYYPDWYSRYPDCHVSNNYLTTSKVMRWNDETLSDTTGIRQMTAEEVADILF